MNDSETLHKRPKHYKTFCALDKVYESDFTKQSPVYARLVLTAAIVYNHQELVVRMLCPQYDVKQLPVVLPLRTPLDINWEPWFFGSSPIPTSVSNGMQKTKCRLRSLAIYEKYLRAVQSLDGQPAWTTLTTMVRNKCFPSLIIHTLNKEFGNQKKSIFSLYFTQLLITAEEQNHTELVRYMFTDQRKINMYVAVIVIRPPLTVAIRSKRVELVELLVSVGSPLTWKWNCKYTTRLTRVDGFYVTSAVEVASFFDRVDMLKTLVFRDNVNVNEERGMALHLACTHGAVQCVAYLLTTAEGLAALNTYDDHLLHHSGTVNRKIRRYFFYNLHVIFKLDGVRMTPLHLSVCNTVLDAGRKRWSSRCRPQVVKMLIEAGARVNDVNSAGETPLCYLARMVGELHAIQDPFLSSDRLAYTETARLLLESGSSMRDHNDDSVLHNLLHYDILDNDERAIMYIKRAVSTDNNMLLIINLIELLLQHGVDTRAKQGEGVFHVIVLRMASELAKAFDLIDSINYLSCTPRRCQALLDRLECLYRSLLLSGSGRHYETDLNDAKYSLGSLWRSVTYLAQYSRKHEKSLRFLRLIFNSMSARQVNQLVAYSTRRLENTDASRQDWVLLTQDALKLMKEVKLPFSLKELARRAITGAMRYRCLQEGLARVLQLPSGLDKYILRLDN